MEAHEEHGDKTLLDKLGVTNPEEAKRLIDAGRKDHNRTGYLERRLEELSEKLEDRHEDEEEEQFADPSMKKMHGEMRQLRKMVSGLVRQNDPEIAKLEPYFKRVREEHPGLWELKDGPTRLAAVRSLAATLYDKDHPEEGTPPPKEDITVDPRTHREGGGGSIQTAGESEPDSSKLQKLLDAAKSDEEKTEIVDAFTRKHYGEDGSQ